MNIINNRLTDNCDKETRIYCKSFNSFQDGLKAFEADGIEMSDLDLSSLGLYLCKCVEQEINSTVVQLIRYYLGIDMPVFYCRRHPSFDRYRASVDTGPAEDNRFDQTLAIKASRAVRKVYPWRAPVCLFGRTDEVPGDCSIGFGAPVHVETNALDGVISHLLLD